MTVCERCFPLDAVLVTEMCDAQHILGCRADAHHRFLETFRRCIVVTYTETCASAAPAYPRTFLQNDVFLVDIPADVSVVGLSAMEFLYIDHCMQQQGGETWLVLTGHHVAAQWAITRVLQFLGHCGPDVSIPSGVRYTKLMCPKRANMSPFVYRQSVVVPAGVTVLGTVVIERVK